MPITITIHKNGNAPTTARIAQNIAIFLVANNWDDFGYKTLFHLSVENIQGDRHHIGDVKIAFADQPQGWTRDSIQDLSPGLSSTFFSVGQDSDYYKNISELPTQIRNAILSALRDVAYDENALNIAINHRVFGTSLLRTLELSTIQGQYARILDGGAILTPFHFGYMKAQAEFNAGISLEFSVRPDSTPSTNIHVLIGRNGIGKTTLLNNMISCLVDEPRSNVDVGNFYDLENRDHPINNRYFTSIVSTSFSAFDPFTPPANRDADNDAIRYTYVGLKDVTVSNGERVSRHKDIHELAEDFLRSLNSCFSLEKKKGRWVTAIECLSSDSNFAEMNLSRLADESNFALREQYARQFFTKMSSGHAVVLLTLTKFVERIEEKTLVLMDEPESHLHPPLLSAFIRALSLLLNNRNGVAIIATHSPVILQEVPKNCVWKLRRTRLNLNADRPDEETFGENVGTLTRDVFGLEVVNSGFHNMLKKSVDEGKSYEQIIHEYDGQIGFEGRAMLGALISNRGE